MKRKTREIGEGHVEEKDLDGALDNQSNVRFKPGDVIWVKHHGNSWWPGQIVDENTVSSRNKPRKKRTNEEVLVRLYGSYEYSFVDPTSSLAGFDNALKRHKGSHKEIIEEALKQGLRTNRGSTKAKGNEESGMDDNDQSSQGDDIMFPKAGESARKLKVMQDLGLIAPSGSPFHKNGRTLTFVR